MMGDNTVDPAAKPSPAKRIVRVLVGLVVLVFIFGWLLPQFIDYELIWEAVSGLTWGDLILLTALSLLRVPTEALIYRAMLPGLRIVAGSGAYLSSNVAANVMPPPASSIVQFAYFRAEGFDSQASMTGAVGSFIFPQGGRILLPIPALLLLVAVGGADSEALLIAGISAAVAALVCVLIRLIGRSEKSARWVGAKLGQFVSWIMVKLHKDPVGDLGDQVVDFRDNAFAVVRRRWRIGSIAVALNLTLTYLILVVSLRAVGVGGDQIGLSLIFASFAVAFFAGVVIPVTGSGLGVVDVVMVSALSASMTGSVDVNVVVAAVVLWRLFYGLIALFPGSVTLTRFTSANRDLISSATAEFGAANDGDSASGPVDYDNVEES